MKRNGNNKAMMASKAQIPKGWRLVRLGDVAEVVGGSTPSRTNDEFWSGNVPWVVPSELTGLKGRYLVSTKESITEKGMRAAGLKLIPSGSVLLTSRATVGVAVINKLPVVTNQGFQNLVAKKGTHALWLFYFISMNRHELEQRAAGSTFLEVSRDSVRSLPILLPPLPEQQSIAAVLDSIDDAIERTDAVIAATEQLRDSLLHQLLTRGVPGWHTEWKEAPGLGTIPADWEVVRLGDRIKEGPTNGIYKPESEYGSGIFLIRIDNFISGAFVNTGGFQRIRVTEEESRRYAVREGDILINRVNSLSHIGKSVLIPRFNEPTLFESNMMKLRMDSSVHPKFAELLLLSDGSRRYFITRAKKAVQQASINQQDVAGLPLPVPPLPEQQAIVATLDGVDVTLEQTRTERDGLRLLKESAADGLLTGRVRVGELKNQDPSD